MLENKNKVEAVAKSDSKAARKHKTLTIIGIILCVILVPVLIINCTLIVKSYINKDEVPDFAGTIPLIVLTDSMYPEIKSGDLIFCRTADANDIQVGDVISFFDPASSSSAVVTHQVVDKYQVDGKWYFKTKGTNNNTEDILPAPADNLVGVYSGFRIPWAGNIAMFMQTVPGLIICIVLPIILFIGYDLIRRKQYEKNKSGDVQALMAELEALKAAKATEKTESAEESSADITEEEPTDKD